jgi:hypothetical protein
MKVFLLVLIIFGAFTLNANSSRMSGSDVVSFLEGALEGMAS